MLLKLAISTAALAGVDELLPKAAGASDPSLAPENEKVIKMTQKNNEGAVTAPWLAQQLGFQLAHEQFPVPELVNLGVATEQAGFDLLAVSDHLRRGRPMRAIPDKHGSR